MVGITDDDVESKDVLTDEEQKRTVKSRLFDTIGRREFVKGSSAAMITGILGYSASGSTAADSSVVDTSKMEEVQVDVSSGDEVSGIVENVSSGQLLVFPSGTFSWSNPAIVAKVQDWGIKCQSDTEFIVPEGAGDGEAWEILNVDRCNNVYFEGLTYDSPGRSSAGMKITTKGNVHVNGLHYKFDGLLSTGTHQDALIPFALESDAYIRVDDYRQFNNGDLGGYGSGDTRVGCWTGSGHEGTVEFYNPVLQGFPNNAFYTSRVPDGKIIINDGLFQNNNVAAVRVSGAVEVYDTTVYINTDYYLDNSNGVIEANKHNLRAFRGDTGGGVGPNGGIVQNCDVVFEKSVYSSALAFPGDNDRIDLDGCQFLIEQSINGLAADASDNEMGINSVSVDGNPQDIDFGSGDLLGSNNAVNPDIPPGTISGVSPSGYAFDWSAVHPETPGAGSGSPENAPAVDGLSLSEVETDDSDAEFDADWQVSDADGDLSSVELVLTQDSDGSTEHLANLNTSGDTASGTTRLVAADDEGSSNGYTVELTVTDSNGNATSGTASADETETSDHTLAVVAEDGVDRVDYSFTTTGEIVKGSNADSGESITQNDDGTWTATGAVADGGTDDFEFDGSLENWNTDSDESLYSVYVDGTEATQLYESEHLLEVVAEDGVDRVDYSFTTTGEIVKGSNADSGESITQNDDGTWTATGAVAGGGTDDFEFDGSLEDWSADPDESTYAVYLDGSELVFESAPTVVRYEVNEADSPNPHANITAEWDVSDEDGDLASGLVEVVDSSGSVVASAVTDINGDVHYGFDYFELTNVDGETFEVNLTVTDESGYETTTSATVSE